MNRQLLLLTLLEEEEDDELLLTLHEKRKRNTVKNMYKNRGTEGYSNILIGNHLCGDDVTHRQFFRLSNEQVQFVLNLVGEHLQRNSYERVKQPISPKEKLLLTLRFLATGESFRSLSFAFRISPSYISIIVRDVLSQLVEKLVPIFLPVPTVEDFKKISVDFETKWNYPNCVGAIDGKHIRVRSPQNSGSLYFNYKNYFSIVLLALVDANYKFSVIDVGSYGKEGDSGIFEKSAMGRNIRSGEFNFPDEQPLPRSDVIVPHTILGDEAFRLTHRMMKPFPKNQACNDRRKRIFNYRLCRARRVSENAFGILCQTFRIFYSPISVLPETTDKITIAACCLHNMLRDESIRKNGNASRNEAQEQRIATLATDNMAPLAGAGGFGNAEGFDVRNRFAAYFSSPEGAVEWQEDFV